MQKLLDNIFLMLTQVYLSKGRHKTVVVVGSVGKTSVAQAIATVLSEKYQTKVTKGNYNTHRGLAMTVFDQTIPSSRFGWAPLVVDALFKTIFTWPKCNMLVLELGIDRRGDLEKFSFLRPDIAVVTATTPEHMENFGTIDVVAQEELSVAKFSDKVLINTELVPEKFIHEHVPREKLIVYGRGTSNTVGMVKDEVVISLKGVRISSKEFGLIGNSGLSTLLTAAVVGQFFAMDGMEIKQGLNRIRPVAGRMNKFTGLNGSTIIDDTYNSSPESVHSALEYLCAHKATRRIALLGTINEMGGQSEKLHRQVGKWCVPKDIDLLVTLGDEANLYIAEEAEINGCKVVRTTKPDDAGKLIAKQLSMGVVVLAKGSQNGVYAEEAVKQLLADPADISKLVRQTGYWPAKKESFFVNG